MMREPEESFFENLAINRQDKLRSRNANRGRIEIIGDILAICLEGKAIRTHIMYRGNLSHLMLKEYTKELAGKGLLEEMHGGSFRTTEKGRTFLKYYERVKEMLAEDETHLDATSFIPAGSKLLSLGVSEKFIKNVKISDEQARDLIKGILYLKERLKELPSGN